jgi:RecA/RadA recombinase
LDRGQLAEICGDSGSGKTQWALTVAADSALRRLRGTGGGGTLYVDARCRCGQGDAAAAPAAHDARQQSTNVRRLREIVAARLAAEASASKSQPRVSPEGAAGTAPAANDAAAEAGLPRPALATISPADVEATVAAVMSNVVALEAANAADGLLECLDQVEEEIVMRNHAAAGEDGGSNPSGSSAPTLPVSLVVVDGMSSLFSEPFPSPPDQQLQQRRAGLLLAAAQQLKRIALQHNVAVLVLNHGTGVGGESSGHRRRGLGPDGVDEEEGEGDGPMEEVDGGGPSYGLPSSTALGTAWHHCVSTRIVVRQSFLGEGLSDGDAPPPTGSAEGVASTLLAGERTAVLTKSCTAPCPAGPFPFRITSRGVEGRV